MYSNRGRLAILGAGGHAKVVAETALLSGWNAVDFFEDGCLSPRQFEVWTVSGNTDMMISYIDQYQGVFIAIGNAKARMERLRQLKSAGGKMISLVHPKATVSKLSSHGEGCLFVAGSIVNPFSRLGDGCIINTGSTVDHDCILGDYVHVAPGANIAGSVWIGDRVWIGAGACIRDRIIIGNDAFIGAGAAVVSDVIQGQTVVGVPAKSLI